MGKSLEPPAVTRGSPRSAGTAQAWPRPGVEAGPPSAVPAATPRLWRKSSVGALWTRGPQKKGHVKQHGITMINIKINIFKMIDDSNVDSENRRRTVRRRKRRTR